MEPTGPYHPIACDFHDRLESYATLRQRVRLSLATGDSGSGDRSVEGRIADIYTREDKQEFLRLDNGAEIRLDRIVEVSPVG